MTQATLKQRLLMLKVKENPDRADFFLPRKKMREEMALNCDKLRIL